MLLLEGCSWDSDCIAHRSCSSRSSIGLWGRSRGRKGERRSISHVVREIVERALEQRRQQEDAELQRDLSALERIRQHREEILAERGGKPLEYDVVEAINQAREEQDARNFAVLFGHLEHRG
jgi:hypothetical protein